MGKQYEITSPSKLLDKEGNLIQQGWARQPLMKYNRENINARWWRIKEWDYYAILTQKYGIAFTLTDLGIMSLFNITWLDFETEEFTVSEDLKFLTRGNTGLPRSSQHGDVSYNGKKMKLEFIREETHRLIKFEDSRFDRNKGIEGEIRLDQPSDQESMVIATPWNNKPGKFYYNEKINCLPATGKVSIGDSLYEFLPNSAYGVLDWGRGVWPYSDTWYWASASGIQQDIRVGINLGYGFGDLSKATENIVFVDGIGHKLDQITFHLDTEDYLKPWQFTSNDDRLNLEMEPILDRNSNVNFLIFKSNQHQVFGRYNGEVVLDDGSILKIQDLLGFAEKVDNRW